MNNKIMFSLLVLGIVSISSLGYAEVYNKSLGIRERKIIGTVESVNADKNLFVINDSDVTKRETVHATAAEIASLQVGAGAVSVAKGDNNYFVYVK